MNNFSFDSFRDQFPLIEKYNHSISDKNTSISALVYFDNAATTQKPNTVIDCHNDYYQHFNANVHRASHKLSTQSTFAFERARVLVKNFIGADSQKEIIWTKGATESINLVVQSLARSTLSTGDEIVLCVSEHHANIVPWQIVAEQTGAIIKVLPITRYGHLDLDELDNIISNKTKFVACAHVSNVLGKINPIEHVIAKAKSVGAISVIDGSQAVAHFPVDVQLLDCDFYVFSAHKMFGPTGVGVLYGKQSLLESMPPYQGGGEMIKTVSLCDKTVFNALPFKFEAGTPNIAGIIAFAESINLLSTLFSDKSQGYQLYEKKLTQYCYQALSKIEQVSFIVKGAPDIGVIAFTLIGHHNHDIAVALDVYGIAIRSGHHCAQPLMTELKINGCLRVSLAAYNTVAEIDYFIDCLQAILQDNIIKEPSEKVLIEAKVDSLITTEEVISLLNKGKGWDSRHREIMLLGKNLPRLDKAFRNEKTLISGCESLAWLSVECNEQGLYLFTADSDAKVIRGLLMIVLIAFNGKTSQQIHKFDITQYFERLGLLQHLSPSRGNGLLAIVEKIKTIAAI